MADSDQDLNAVFDEVRNFERGARDGEIEAEIDQSERIDSALRARGESGAGSDPSQ